MTETDDEIRHCPASIQWCSIGGAVAGGMLLYAVLMPLLASIVLQVISPLCETVAALTVLDVAVSWVLPGLLMIGVGLAAGFLWWRIPLRVGLAAGIGAAATSLLSTLSLPVMAVNESRIIGECIMVMAAGLLGGVLARRHRSQAADEAADRKH